jgi:NADH:ubiquinone oxidoreductase subunit D
MIQERIKVGPVDLALPGAMELTLGMQGDRILEVEVKFGYLRRAIQEEMVGKNYPEAQLRFGRIDPESGMILDRLFSEAVEEVTETRVSERTLWIREITTTLSELNGFLKYLAKMASRMGIDVLTHVVLKHRESLLDLAELLTGSRYGYYYIIPGGVRYDLTEGFQERLENWIKNFTLDFPRVEALFRWTHPIQNRLQSLGRVLDNGEYGFVSESSIETTRYGLVSHVESRLLFALKQSRRLCQDLHELMDQKAQGSALTPLGSSRKKNEVEKTLETARGEWSLTLKLNDALHVKSVSTRLPSDSIVKALAPALAEEYFEDLPLILESLNFSIPEIDR